MPNIPGFNVELKTSAQFKWAIGPYNAVARLAKRLRTDAELRAELAALDVRVGRRSSDVPPAGPARFPSIDSAKSGARMPTPSKLESTWSGKRSGNAPFNPRDGDLRDGANAYYLDRTLESHHIVERSILRDLEVDHGDLAPNRAPCVLVVRELHQRLFTSEIASLRQELARRPNDPAGGLRAVYERLYAPTEFVALKREAMEIIDEVERRLR